MHTVKFCQFSSINVSFCSYGVVAGVKFYAEPEWVGCFILYTRKETRWHVVSVTYGIMYKNSSHSLSTESNSRHYEHLYRYLCTNHTLLSVVFPVCMFLWHTMFIDTVQQQ